MDSSRVKFGEILADLLGSMNVYFQPPSSVQMKYPAIVYHRNDQTETYANDYLYLGKTMYVVKYIDRNPDSDIPSRIARLQYSSFSQYYVADGLNHYVYSVYY